MQPAEAISKMNEVARILGWRSYSSGQSGYSPAQTDVRIEVKIGRQAPTASGSPLQSSASGPGGFDAEARYRRCAPAGVTAE